LFIRRLQEAFSYENTRYAVSMCRQLICHFNFKVSNEVKIELARTNRKCLVSKNRHEVRLIGVNLLYDKAFKSLEVMISRNPKLRKITLSFCGLTTNKAQQLLAMLSNRKHLYYICEYILKVIDPFHILER
jgi:hypothetical protein